MKQAATKIVSRKAKPVLGWREWIALPDYGVKQIKVKVDSGAKTSALHAEEIEIFKRAGKYQVRFKIFPIQRSKASAKVVVADLVDQRHVRSSVGHRTFRPVVSTDMVIGGEKFPIEITLVNRDILGFRMLLGRQAIKGRYWIDPAHSFLIGKKKKKRRP